MNRRVVVGGGDALGSALRNTRAGPNSREKLIGEEFGEYKF
jgi:hypothetical protein